MRNGKDAVGRVRGAKPTADAMEPVLRGCCLVNSTVGHVHMFSAGLGCNVLGRNQEMGEEGEGGKTQDVSRRCFHTDNIGCSEGTQVASEQRRVVSMLPLQSKRGTSTLSYNSRSRYAEKGSALNAVWE